MKNQIIISVDKIKGNVETSAKGTKYLKEGTIHMGKENVRVSWLRPDEELIGRGGLVFADLEINHNPSNGKNYPQLSVTGAVPVAVNENSAYIVGEVVEIKELNKLVSARVRFSHTNWNKETHAGEVAVKVFDKASPMGIALIAAKGKGQYFIQGELAPSNGFIEFKATKLMPFGGQQGTGEGIALGTAADVVEEEAPF